MMSSRDGESNLSFQVTHPGSFCVAPLTFELKLQSVSIQSLGGRSQISN